ncbi:hypothetical protein PLICRDRAFT_663471 [Plicaturopsis crispa FD-325 SS-3]|nr:hypothetical protein PLICRDRAFT_663471 [Plicaturopsis crispa FD-325 SS-3]
MLPSDLSDVVTRLTSLSDADSIGCLSAPLPGHAFDGSIACSLAVFDGRASRVFRSTIPGRAAPQVGRWHAFRKKDDEPLDTEKEFAMGATWEDIWDRSASVDPLPAELQDLSPQSVDTILYLSDGASEGLSNSLSVFQGADKLGLIASSTPFITGRPVTLFHNGAIHSSGAVGLALHGGKQSPTAHVDFSGLQGITAPLTVTRSEGNLVNELDGLNPTMLLLDAVAKSGIESKGSFKEDDFYVGVLREGKLHQVYRVISGDPSRGTMALESHAAPAEGTTIQIYHRPETAPPHIPSRYTLPAADRRTLTFAASAAELHTEVSSSGADDTRVLANTFLAASENGFSLSRGKEAAWRCAIPGGLAGLSWSLGR